MYFTLFWVVVCSFIQLLTAHKLHHMMWSPHIIPESSLQGGSRALVITHSYVLPSSAHALCSGTLSANI